MKLIKLPIRKKEIILALGAESAGVFAVFKNGNIFVSENFGDLLAENNFLKYKKAVLDYFKKEKIKPDVILTDLHPLYRTTILGEELAQKYQIPQMKVQHHIAHIFSAVSDRILLPTTHYPLPTDFTGIAMDGTGYGLDGNIWGGEVFKFKVKSLKLKVMERIGSLEEQAMIGGDLAVREPARMIIAILAKIPNPKSQIPIKSQTLNSKQILIYKYRKDFIYQFVKRFYSRNEFEVLYNQMEQNFNCQKTTSTGRVLDAVSVLLGFAGNERSFKHEAVKLLEANSTVPYNDLDLRFKIYDLRIILNTAHLFKYLIKNIHKDKRRLAATAQLYIAKGLYEITRLQPTTYNLQPIFAAGGMTNNKIISAYLENHGVYLSKKIPRGDEGIAFGQAVYYCIRDLTR
ncbi:hypothetical protein KKB43_04385 [Patescibacteria group bacterium]|nr:hypothetical protein [Patescibacteria group bacterium]